jgi:hypothetical protein
MPDRCRLCTTNDREGLAEQLAAEMYESRRDREVDPPWEDAGAYWHQAMRQFAEATLSMLERGHGG